MSTPSVTKGHDAPAARNAAILVIFLLVDSLHFVWARLLYAHLSPAVSAMFVLLIGTIEIGIYGLVTKQLRWQIFKDYWKFFLLLGGLVALSTYLTYDAMGFIDPGTASFLNQISTVFSLLFGLLWLKEKFSAVQYIGVGIALLGLVVFTYQAGDYLRLGTLMILIASFCYSLHAAVTKKYLVNIEFVNFFFFRLFCTAAGLFAIASVTRTLTWPTWQAWLLLLLIGTLDTTISRSLYYLVLRRINITLMTILLTLSPVLTVLWSLLLFGTLPGKQQMIGGVILVAGVFVVSVGNQLYKYYVLRE